MGRKKGSRSAGYEEKRAELATRVFRCIMDDGGISLNAMADFTGVSRPTLRHYFGDRDGAVRAALETASEIGSGYVRQVQYAEGDTAAEALRNALEFLVVGWRDYRVGRLHEVGLKVGLEDLQTGRTYLEAIFEPMLRGFESLVLRLQSEGKIARDRDPRTLALAVVSPVVMALLHQGPLGGKEIRALDIGPVLEEVIQMATGQRPS
ncbi:MAG: TetR/AcrR family transcriptional regulator [Myxococcota bacterium]